MFFRRIAMLAAIAIPCSCSGGGSTTQAVAASANPAPTAVAPTVGSAAAGLATANVSVGPGFSDVSPHQVVRSSADRVYVAVPTCSSPTPCDGNALVMYAANGSGTPTGFTPLDAADEPQSVGASDAIGTSAIAIDGNDLIWVAYTQRSDAGAVKVATFDATRGEWTSTQEIQGVNDTGFYQGSEGATIALDANGAPHVAYDAGGSDGKLHVMYVDRTSGAWSTPVQIDDEAIPSGNNAIHPTIAFGPDGSLLFAWIDGPVAEYSAGTIRTRVRSAGGTFSPSTLISGEALSTVDDGPSLLITSDGTHHLAFIGAGAIVQYRYGPDGVTWYGDRQPPAQESHDPSLGPDGASGIYIYGHGTPEPGINGVGQNLYRFHLAAGADAWSPFALWVSGTYDCSVSTRWSQFFMRFPTELDAVYWNSGSAPNALLLGEN